MRAEPNSGASYGSGVDYPNLSPEMRDRIAFPNSDGATKWYVWVLGQGCAVSDDSLHVGLNGQKLNGGTRGIAENMTGWNGCAFAWKSEMESGNRPYIQPNYSDTNSAFQTLNIWMKEDGMRVDKVILTTDSSDKILKIFISQIRK